MWKAGVPSAYHITCHAMLGRDTLTIRETAICASTTEAKDWMEPSLAICNGLLEIRRGRMAFPTMTY